MKERIVIEKELLEKLIKALPVQWFDNEGEKKIVLFGKEYKTEKEPTNWEELKELCKKTGHYAVNILKSVLLDKEYIFIFGLSFKDNGNIEDIENNNIAENRTPAQMWQIIKGLIGE